MKKICPLCKSKRIKMFLDGTCFCFNCENYFDSKTRKGITNSVLTNNKNTYKLSH